jgi:hypothetical protein
MLFYQIKKNNKKWIIKNNIGFLFCNFHFGSTKKYKIKRTTIKNQKPEFVAGIDVEDDF